MPVDPEALAFVDKLIGEEPVLLFALEWCEFCWATRKLFKAHDIPYRSIDLDSVAYQKEDWGGRVRRAVGARVGGTTIPQVFVAGELIGGNAELFDGARRGTLQTKLGAAGIAFNADAKVDYASLLPKWLKQKSAA
jgi:cysteine synthase A